MRSGGVGTLGIYIHTCTHTHTYTCIHCVKRERASGHVLWDWIGLDWIAWAKKVNRQPDRRYDCNKKRKTSLTTTHRGHELCGTLYSSRFYVWIWM